MVKLERFDKYCISIIILNFFSFLKKKAKEQTKKNETKRPKSTQNQPVSIEVAHLNLRAGAVVVDAGVVVGFNAATRAASYIHNKIKRSVHSDWTIMRNERIRY